MGIPSNVNSVIALSSTNPSIIGDFMVSSFVVNPTGANWQVQVNDKDGFRLFGATSSAAAVVPFSHTLNKPLQAHDLIGTTLSNIVEVLVYLI